MWPFNASTEDEDGKITVMKETITTTTIEYTETTIYTEQSGEGTGVSIEEIRSELDAISLTDRSRATASPSGHLGNLTFSQSQALFHLWGMLLEYLQRPYDKKAAARKDKQLAALLFEQSLETASSTSSLAESERSQLSSGRSSAIQANPLSTEFWCQAGSGDLDVLLLRFLRARKWDLHAAFAMLRDALEWRKMYGVRELIAQGEAGIKPELLASGKSYFWKQDAQGRLVTIITGRLHDKNAQTLEETCRFTVYQMELGRRLMQAPSETVTVIFDMADAPYASLDFGSIQFMVQCFQSFYPESLGKCLIVNPPWIFSGFFRMVKPLLDPVVAAKIELVTPGEEMLKWIPAENLPERFGGSCKWEYSWKPSENSSAPLQALEDDEVMKLEMELVDLQTRLIDATISLNSLYANAEELGLTAGDETLVALGALRDEIKREIGGRQARLDANGRPSSLYDRIGVVKPGGSINWNVAECCKKGL